MVYMVILAAFLWISASAVGVYPGMQREVAYLTAAAAVTTAAGVIWALAAKGKMFSDIAALSADKWLPAVLAVAFCAALGAAVGLALKRKKRR